VSLRALLLTRTGEDAPDAEVVTLDDDALPEGEVTIDVTHSSLNYKDALVLAGAPGLVRTYPHVPGIDLAGTVRSSTSVAVPVGADVLVTGCSLGERHWGGMAERARVPADWVIVRPEGLGAERAMALGTAGFTAQLALDVLRSDDVGPQDGPVLVTGATGGVGALAVHLLAQAGFEVTAATGRAGDPDARRMLTSLGAAEVIARSMLEDAADRTLGSARYVGVVDVAGGRVLAGALTLVRPRGVVAVCGLAADRTLVTTVMPFILRGVSLRGIDSVLHPVGERPEVWRRLSGAVDRGALEGLTRTIGLAEVPAASRRLLAEGGRGRTVVDCRR